MIRSFSPIDLVTVPRTSAASALALGTALLAAARKKDSLPQVFAAPLEQLTKEHGELRTSRQYQREGRALDAAAATAADQQLDSTWSGFHGFLTGWTKLPSTPEGVAKGRMAREVIELVFPEGLRFLNLPYREQWGESQTRLDRLGEPAIAERVSALGGEPFVRAIEAAHAEYGAALHVTEPEANPTPQVKVREPLDNFWEAVRSYALRVSNYLDENKHDPEAQKLGYALLKPLATWKSAGVGRKAQAPEAPSEDEGPGGEPGDETDDLDDV
ncbi:MAG TPA: hypothetical protein VFS43_36805 [Polyangiaceae bacterium]|nr:hypothetical protein [Polyangiaceae bacterium]